MLVAPVRTIPTTTTFAGILRPRRCVTRKWTTEHAAQALARQATLRSLIIWRDKGAAGASRASLLRYRITRFAFSDSAILATVEYLIGLCLLAVLIAPMCRSKKCPCARGGDSRGGAASFAIAVVEMGAASSAAMRAVMGTFAVLLRWPARWCLSAVRALGFLLRGGSGDVVGGRPTGATTTTCSNPSA